MKSVLWRVAKCLSYIEEARCLKVKSMKDLNELLRNRIRALPFPPRTPPHRECNVEVLKSKNDSIK